jgi:hypothetical protein
VKSPEWLLKKGTPAAQERRRISWFDPARTFHRLSSARPGRVEESKLLDAATIVFPMPTHNILGVPFHPAVTLSPLSDTGCRGGDLPGLELWGALPEPARRSLCLCRSTPQDRVL